MKYYVLGFFGVLSACAAPSVAPPVTEPSAVVLSGNTGLRPTARPDGGLALIVPPTTVAVNPEAALGKPEVTIKTLGTTVASLGNPAEPGLWMKTPLVAKEQLGEVTAAGGTKVTVTLIPIDGPKTGASQLSLQAMQALGVPLTALPEVAVSLL